MNGRICEFRNQLIENLKIPIYESGSETTKLKTRVTVGLIADDGKMECIVYHGDGKSTRLSYEEAKEFHTFELTQAFEKCITTALNANQFHKCLY